MNEMAIELPEGRTVAWWEFGDPDATTVVLNCHGGLMDGRDVALTDGVARERGIRIVSPDRPGVGGTSRARHSGMLPWVQRDVRPLLDHLGIASCAVMGWSEGGQYALAIAHELPERITRAAVIAGALPLDDPQNRAHLNRPDRRLAALSEHAPTLAHAYFAAARRMGRHVPDRFAAASARVLDATDQAVIHAHEDWFVSSALGAMDDLGGATDEYRVFVAPWGFAPEGVTVPVDVHQGSADQLIEPEWAEELAARLMHGRLIRWPGEGHFIAVTRRAEILERIVEAG
ncbi:alpha/beta hydrolase [Microbacterium sp. ET2]|uniref:alpha/beta fold hydrolase n=1 Tax=Microbacterium albipurpureum TaxID=3050384 RepID=UPI00259CC515|nr:alpha/beta hydrolase [Microbacterium sp. ET2 (Ac-2212)]WJL94682.1 alpha/beta hydrolase [Microbacterium sp. ET2 (Ac-2212)]